MDSEELGMMAGFGFVMQYLRGFAWFGDGLTLLGGVSVALVMAFKSHGPSPLMIGIQAAAHFLEIFGGLGLGHLASRHTKMVPKFNAYSDSAEDGQGVSD
jgi:hypothetical protein